MLQVLGDPRDPGISDLTTGQGQRPDVPQARGDVRHTRVGDAVAEGDVELVEPGAALGEEADSDIGDIVTAPEVQLAKARHPGQRLEAGVRHRDAEA